MMYDGALMRNMRETGQPNACPRATSNLDLNLENRKNALDENPYFKPLPASASYSTAWTNDEYKEVKALLPLNTGIFSNDKIFPIAMTEGLIVETFCTFFFFVSEPKDPS